jgi:hypothetical protein
MKSSKERLLYREINNTPPTDNTGKMGGGKFPNLNEQAFLHDVRAEGMDAQDIFSEETAQAVQMRLEGKSLSAIGGCLGVSARSAGTLIRHAEIEWEDYIS